MTRRPARLLVFLTLLATFAAAQPAAAYIGPGAGVAFLSGGLVLIGALFLAVAIVLAYPIKVLLRLMSGKGRIKGATKSSFVGNPQTPQSTQSKPNTLSIIKAISNCQAWILSP